MSTRRDVSEELEDNKDKKYDLGKTLLVACCVSGEQALQYWQSILIKSVRKAEESQKMC